MAAFCERRLLNRKWCIRDEKHRGPHMDSDYATNADLRRQRAIGYLNEKYERVSYAGSEENRVY